MNEAEQQRKLAHDLAGMFSVLDSLALILDRDVLNGNKELNVEELVSRLRAQALRSRALSFLARGAMGPYEQAMAEYRALPRGKRLIKR